MKLVVNITQDDIDIEFIIFLQYLNIQDEMIFDEYKMKDLEELRYFLDIQIYHDRK